MSENSEFEARKQPAPAVEGDSGQYVDGDYGKAGIAREDEKTAVEGEYSEGDYGVAGAVEKQAGAVEGEYSEGDYGTIGAEEVPEEHRLVEDEVPVEEDADDEDEDLPRDPA